jgi:protein gp37
MNRATPNDSWVQNPDGTPGYTSNIITGCDLQHDYCFARKLAEGRLRERYLANRNYPELEHSKPLTVYERDPFYPRFWPERIKELDDFLLGREKPTGVFLNIMGDWGCGVIPHEWLRAQFDLIERHPRHRFYLLTHHPEALTAWSPFPLNCWVGVTANADGDMTLSITRLADVEAGIRFISIEPYIGFISMAHNRIEGVAEWVIIGAMTCGLNEVKKLSAHYPALTPMQWGNRWTLQPRIEWVAHIVRFCDEAGVPVYLKENLIPLFSSYSVFDGIKAGIFESFHIDTENPKKNEIKIRQEMPRD